MASASGASRTARTVSSRRNICDSL
jgi:hypothetical protein